MFLKTVASVKSDISLVAFAISAVLAVVYLYLLRTRQGKSSGNVIIWLGIGAIFFLGLAPFLANAYLRSIDTLSVYRIRVLVLDSQHVPISGATLRTTASNETTETSQGVGIVSVYRATMPADGKVTIFADLEAAFLHGQSGITLSKDPNPSLMIELKSNTNALVSGIVEDAAGHAIAAAMVTVLGGDSTQTASNGTFTVKTNAAVDQQVRLHIEKTGYTSIDQYHPAGREPVTIMLVNAKHKQ